MRQSVSRNGTGPKNSRNWLPCWTRCAAPDACRRLFSCGIPNPGLTTGADDVSDIANWRVINALSIRPIPHGSRSGKV
jgi:hypothetical protein